MPPRRGRVIADDGDVSVPISSPAGGSGSDGGSHTHSHHQQQQQQQEQRQQQTLPAAVPPAAKTPPKHFAIPAAVLARMGRAGAASTAVTPPTLEGAQPPPPQHSSDSGNTHADSTAAADPRRAAAPNIIGSADVAFANPISRTMTWGERHRRHHHDERDSPDSNNDDEGGGGEEANQKDDAGGGGAWVDAAGFDTSGDGFISFSGRGRDRRRLQQRAKDGEGESESEDSSNSSDHFKSPFDVDKDSGSSSSGDDDGGGGGRTGHTSAEKNAIKKAKRAARLQRNEEQYARHVKSFSTQFLEAEEARLLGPAARRHRNGRTGGAFAVMEDGEGDEEEEEEDGPLSSESSYEFTDGDEIESEVEEEEDDDEEDEEEEAEAGSADSEEREVEEERGDATADDWAAAAGDDGDDAGGGGFGAARKRRRLEAEREAAAAAAAATGAGDHDGTVAAAAASTAATRSARERRSFTDTETNITRFGDNFFECHWTPSASTDGHDSGSSGSSACGNRGMHHTLLYVNSPIHVEGTCAVVSVTEQSEILVNGFLLGRKELILLDPSSSSSCSSSSSVPSGAAAADEARHGSHHPHRPLDAPLYENVSLQGPATLTPLFRRIHTRSNRDDVVVGDRANTRRAAAEAALHRSVFQSVFNRGGGGGGVGSHHGHHGTHQQTGGATAQRHKTDGEEPSICYLGADTPVAGGTNTSADPQHSKTDAVAVASKTAATADDDATPATAGDHHNIAAADFFNLGTVTNGGGGAANLEGDGRSVSPGALQADWDWVETALRRWRHLHENRQYFDPTKSKRGHALRANAHNASVSRHSRNKNGSSNSKSNNAGGGGGHNTAAGAAASKGLMNVVLVLQPITIPESTEGGGGGGFASRRLRENICSPGMRPHFLKSNLAAPAGKKGSADIGMKRHRRNAAIGHKADARGENVYVEVPSFFARRPPAVTLPPALLCDVIPSLLTTMHGHNNSSSGSDGSNNNNTDANAQGQGTSDRSSARGGAKTSHQNTPKTGGGGGTSACNNMIAVVGEKDTGKTTLCKLLINLFFSQSDKTVYYLEGDLGQPLFGPPQSLSLVRIHNPLHIRHFLDHHDHQEEGRQRGGGGFEVVYSVFLGSTSPTCPLATSRAIAALCDACERILAPQASLSAAAAATASRTGATAPPSSSSSAAVSGLSPAQVAELGTAVLVFNSHGWVLPTGRRITAEFIRRLRPKHIVHLIPDPDAILSQQQHHGTATSSAANSHTTSRARVAASLEFQEWVQNRDKIAAVESGLNNTVVHQRFLVRRFHSGGAHTLPPSSSSSSTAAAAAGEEERLRFDYLGNLAAPEARRGARVGNVLADCHIHSVITDSYSQQQKQQLQLERSGGRLQGHQSSSSNKNNNNSSSSSVASGKGSAGRVNKWRNYFAPLVSFYLSARRHAQQQQQQYTSAGSHGGGGNEGNQTLVLTLSFGGLAREYADTRGGKNPKSGSNSSQKSSHKRSAEGASAVAAVAAAAPNRHRCRNDIAEVISADWDEKVCRQRLYMPGNNVNDDDEAVDGEGGDMTRKHSADKADATASWFTNANGSFSSSGCSSFFGPLAGGGSSTATAAGSRTAASLGGPSPAAAAVDDDGSSIHAVSFAEVAALLERSVVAVQFVMMMATAREPTDEEERKRGGAKNTTSYPNKQDGHPEQPHEHQQPQRQCGATTPSAREEVTLVSALCNSPRGFALHQYGYVENAEADIYHGRTIRLRLRRPPDFSMASPPPSPATGATTTAAPQRHHRPDTSSTGGDALGGEAAGASCPLARVLEPVPGRGESGEVRLRAGVRVRLAFSDALKADTSFMERFPC